MTAATWTRTSTTTSPAPSRTAPTRCAPATRPPARWPRCATRWTAPAPTRPRSCRRCAARRRQSATRSSRPTRSSYGVALQGRPQERDGRLRARAGGRAARGRHHQGRRDGHQGRDGRRRHRRVRRSTPSTRSIRDEVEAEAGAKGMKTAEVEAEIKRRTPRLKTIYGDAFAEGDRARWKPTSAASMIGGELNFALAEQAVDQTAMDAATLQIEHESTVDRRREGQRRPARAVHARREGGHARPRGRLPASSRRT